MVEKVPAQGGVCGGCIPARYILAILGSIGMGIIYGLKVNLSVAIVKMLNHTAIAISAGHHHALDNKSLDNKSLASVATRGLECAGEVNEIKEDGPFAWSGTVEGLLLSSYFWGYIVAQLPGGRVAELCSAKMVMFFAVLINIACTVLTPVMAGIHYVPMFLMRIGEGIGGGVTFPAMHVLLAHWAPPNERSLMSNIVYSGTSLGTVVFILVSGLIASSIGWEAVFYIEGGVSAVWLILWLWLVADTPNKQSKISPEERELIDTALKAGGGGDDEETHPPVPWGAVWSSAPFWAILIAHTCSNWGWYMVLIELPTFMNKALKFQIAKNAVLTALPFLLLWFFSMILSKTLDTLVGRKTISTTFARKFSTAIASAVPLLCFVVICFIGCNRVAAVVLMTIAVTCCGAMFSGFLANHIDIAPNFAGTLVALTNTVATIPGITVPIFVSKLTEGDSSITPWHTIFGVTIVLYVIELVAYTSLGSGDEQPWNKPEYNAGEAQPLRSRNA